MSILGITAIVAVVLVSMGILTQSPANSSTTSDVVILLCNPQFNDNPPNPPFQVYASSSSENAPVIERFSNCAQVLADLISADFIIEDVQAPFAEMTQYTLLRNTQG